MTALGLLLVISGCGGASSEGTGSTCSVAGTDAGTVAATVDGQPWSSTVTWTAAGSSVQLNAPTAGDWWFSMVLQSTVDGVSALEAATDGLPASFDLGGSGGWVTLYPAEGASSYTSRDGAGSLTLVDAEGALGACFAFEAVGDEGSVAVDDGRLVATASDG